MLVDSGADQTMIALDILQSLNAKPIDYIRISSLFGASRTTELYVVDLYIGTHHIHAVEVAALPTGDENITGRDVLNQLVVTLNGLAGMTEVAGGDSNNNPLAIYRFKIPPLTSNVAPVIYAPIGDARKRIG